LRPRACHDVVVSEHATKVKICGVTNLDDAERAVELGAWAIGMIFHKPSPRRCTETDAAAIATALKRRAELVGVYVNRPLDEVVSAAERIGLTMIQLHGDEGPAYCDAVAHRTGCRIIKAAQVRDAGDLRALAPFHTDFHLLDAHSRDLRGGTGRTFDWKLVGAHRGTARVITSGGLTPANVAEAITTTKPYAVDVASGVEAKPGRKDPERLEAFFAGVASTAPAGEPQPEHIP
jgi:phosphoribosylanthranilate isomerase